MPETTIRVGDYVVIPDCDTLQDPFNPEISHIAICDGLAVDEDTGELIGRAVPKELYSEELTDSYAEWIMEHLQMGDATIASAAMSREEAQQKRAALIEEAVAACNKDPKCMVLDSQIANCERMEARARHDRNYLFMKYEKDLADWARKKTKGKKRRSVATRFGDACLRAFGPKVSVIPKFDEDVTVAWAETNCPDAIKKVFLVSKLDKPTIERLVEDPASAAAVGLDVTPAGETLTVKTGIDVPKETKK